MKGKSKIQLALWALLFMVAIPISAYGVDGQIKIAQTAATTFPIQINEPGSYVLTSNLIVTTANVNAIKINADNVTLDLNGHGIYRPGTGTGYGIYARNKFNITIKNGIVRGFYYGIYLYNNPDHKGAGHRIEGIQASNNGRNGIYAYYSTVTNCTANNNGDDGISASYSTVTNCTANNNGDDGISASYSTVTNCTANNNDIGINACHSTVTNCTANINGTNGVYAYYSTVTNCTANNNGDDGIYAFHSAVKGCNVRNNTGYGIEACFGCQSYIYRNAASGNTAGQINCPSGNTCVDNATF
ncbi:parallel beta-helix repeat protein [Candidatus Desulfofervidus auxilii]|uniref:Parallel beta-helix repeat protein n=1 Tax=Desulfofervidus auxilii TaxID=1621989 RepID=A0A7U4QJF6_DESA2|nr:right-handed parallel beta-helix repeat-containing protein [Candidatus Desulfofervidus auxilii]AMM40430.1 parallel beta-helix repeat protein [Candidatus Desulfofervidus auxilii]CAD7772140.1 Right handed beta helix region [Candidatus Methanoperedenaceae archaeon GB50]